MSPVGKPRRMVTTNRITKTGSGVDLVYGTVLSIVGF